MAERVRFPAWVSEDELEALYRSATCFVLPSLIEGFGLPVLEAMARGVPVACSNRPALPEVAGDAALLFDPLDQAAVTEAVRRLLRDAELRTTLVERGLVRAREFSWRRTAEADARELSPRARRVTSPVRGPPRAHPARPRLPGDALGAPAVGAPARGSLRGGLPAAGAELVRRLRAEPAALSGQVDRRLPAPAEPGRCWRAPSATATSMRTRRSRGRTSSTRRSSRTGSRPTRRGARRATAIASSSPSGRRFRCSTPTETGMRGSPAGETLAATDLFLAATERARTALLLEGVDPGRIEVVPPGIDVERFRSAPPQTPPDEHLVVSPGRLVWEKGHQDVMRALALLRREGGPAARLLVVGSGPEEARLRAYAGELGIADAVEFRSVPYEEMPAVFARASCMVLASLATASGGYYVGDVPHLFWEEQFGLVLRRGDGRRPADRREQLGRDPRGGRRLGDVLRARRLARPGADPRRGRRSRVRPASESSTRPSACEPSRPRRPPSGSRPRTTGCSPSRRAREAGGATAATSRACGADRPSPARRAPPGGARASANASSARVGGGERREVANRGRVHDPEPAAVGAQVHPVELEAPAHARARPETGARGLARRGRRRRSGRSRRRSSGVRSRRGRRQVIRWLMLLRSACAGWARPRPAAAAVSANETSVAADEDGVVVGHDHPVVGLEVRAREPAR